MFAIRYLVSATALAVALTGSVGAQQLSPDKNLTYEQVKLIAETAYETCVAQGLHVSVHVVGREGETRFAIRETERVPTRLRTAEARHMRCARDPTSRLRGDCPSRSAGRSSVASESTAHNAETKSALRLGSTKQATCSSRRQLQIFGLQNAILTEWHSYSAPHGGRSWQPRRVLRRPRKAPAIIAEVVSLFGIQ